MKKLILVAAVVAMSGCATHIYTSPVNGQQTILRGDAAEFRIKMKDPIYRQSFDAKGPAPQVWLDMVTPECQGNLEIQYFPHRLYWILRANPLNVGKDDRELAITRIEFCRSLQAVGKK